jgi:membrane fusion protein, heavy metal efflux system
MHVLRRPNVAAVALLASSSLLLTCCGDSRAAPPIPDQAFAELEPVSRTVFGERLLAFVEHPPLVRGESARFLVHLTVLATGEPIRAGSVELSIGGTSFVAAAPKRDGLFVPEGSSSASGTHPMGLRVAGGAAEETLDLGTCVVHESTEAARSAAGEPAPSEPPGSVPFLMEQQWTIGLLVAPATSATLSRRLAAPGRVRAPEGAEAIVSSPIAGRFVAAGAGRVPRAGETVEAGAVLGYVEPPLDAAALAQLEATRLELDLEALKIARALGETQARLDYAKAEHARVTKLAEHGLSTAQELDESARNLALAESERQGAGEAAAALERAQSGSRESGGPAAGLRFPLAAPIGGTVIASRGVPGQAVGAGEELLRILDASRVTIEARVSEFDLHRLGEKLSASVSFPALPGARVEVEPAAVGRAWTVLPTVDAESRTLLARCEIDSRGGAIKPGMLAEVELVTERVDAEVVVPAEAVVMDQGLPTAYVMLEGELFQRRDLALGVRDGDRVQVLRGIERGERVATRGAYAVKLVSMAPAGFGHGHEH